MLGIGVTHGVQIVRLCRDGDAKLTHAFGLLLREVAGMMHGKAVILAGVLSQELLEHIECHLHAEVAVDVHMNLIALVPKHPCHPFQFIRRHNPFAFVTVGVAILHLHKLGIKRAIG